MTSIRNRILLFALCAPFLTTQALGQKDLNAALDPVEDDGLQSDFHRENVGRIVFSRSLIPRTERRETITTFDANSEIYLRVFMPASAENIYRQAGRTCEQSVLNSNVRDRRIEARVGNGEWITLEYDSIGHELWLIDTTFPSTDDNGDNVALYDGRPLQAGDDMSGVASFAYANRLVPQLQPGNNSVEFRAVLRCDHDNENEITVATAQVTIRRPAGEISTGLRFENNRLPASLQQNMVRAVARYFSGWEVVKTIATTQWSVEYHPINGHPVSRTSDGYVFLRNRSGTCAYHPVSYTQYARTRNAFHTDMEGSSALGEPTPLPCDSIPRR